MMDCEFEDGVCIRCGFRGRSGLRRNCPVGNKPGLGDLVERALSAIGITKKRVEKITGKPCGCGKRQEALNQLGRKLTG